MVTCKESRFPRSLSMFPSKCRTTCHDGILKRIWEE